MPIYDYRCAACAHRFEVIHGVHAEGPARCPACGSGPVVKAVSAPAVHFKGSGWAKLERRSTRVSAGADDNRPGGDGAADPGDGSRTTADRGSGTETAKDASAPSAPERADPKPGAPPRKGEEGPRPGRAAPSPTASSGSD